MTDADLQAGYFTPEFDCEPAIQISFEIEEEGETGSLPRRMMVNLLDFYVTSNYKLAFGDDLRSGNFFRRY